MAAVSRPVRSVSFVSAARAVLDNEEDAIAMQAELGKDYMVEHRPGERTRCEKFCQVNTYCQQYRDYLSTKEIK